MGRTFRWNYNYAHNFLIQHDLMLCFDNKAIEEICDDFGFRVHFISNHTEKFRNPDNLFKS
ncbi:MAG: hypothetical protein ACTSRP_05465 [Candidatus Helarchaeota archaeon]